MRFENLAGRGAGTRQLGRADRAVDARVFAQGTRHLYAARSRLVDGGDAPGQSHAEAEPSQHGRDRPLRRAEGTHRVNDPDRSKRHPFSA